MSAEVPTPTDAPAPGFVPACNYCRKGHTACDVKRPCYRCVRTGRGHLCADPPPRRRGRPPRRTPLPLDDQQQQQHQKERSAKPLHSAAAAPQPQPEEEEPTAGGQLALMAARVVERQAAEIRQLREANAELELRLARRKESHRAAARRVAELEHRLLQSEQAEAALRAQIEHEHDRRKRRKIADEAGPPAQQQPGAEADADHASPSSVRSLVSSSLPPAQCGGSVLGEALSLMPFLRDYDIRSSLAVVDFSYPVCAFMCSSTDATPPVMIYANAAFCSLTNFSLDQLLGAPFHFSFVVNLHQYKQAVDLTTNRPPRHVTDVYRYHSLLRSSYGPLLRVAQNVQFF